MIRVILYLQKKRQNGLTAVIKNTAGLPNLILPKDCMKTAPGKKGE